MEKAIRGARVRLPYKHHVHEMNLIVHYRAGLYHKVCSSASKIIHARLSRSRGYKTDASIVRYPRIPICPAPRCHHESMPPDLHIAPGPMAMPAYDRHVVVWTGRSDWASRIEDDQDAGQSSDINIARNVRESLNKSGLWHNVGPARCLRVSLI